MSAPQNVGAASDAIGKGVIPAGPIGTAPPSHAIHHAAQINPAAHAQMNGQRIGTNSGQVEVSFQLSREKAKLFKDIAEKDQSLISQLQRFGIHSIRFQGMTHMYDLLAMTHI